MVPQFILDIIASTETFVETFTWKSLVPQFILDIIAAGGKLAKTVAFTYKQLLPSFIVSLIDGTPVADVAKTFGWKDLLPQFIRDIIEGPLGDAAIAFDYKTLLPSFIVSLLDGTPVVDVAKSFTWKDLLPQFIRDFFESKKGENLTKAVKAFDWKTLLPSWIVSIIDGTPIVDVAKAFTWKSLLPQFIRDIIENKGQAAEEGSLLKMVGDMFGKIALAIKTRMVAIIDSIAEVIPGMTSTAEAAVAKMEKLKLFDEEWSGASKVDLERIYEQLKAGTITQGDIAGLLKKEAFDLKTTDVEALAQMAGDAVKGMKIKTFEGEVRQLHTGGLIGAGGIAEVAAGEMMLDNQAAQIFLKAAQLLSSSRAIEQAKMGGGSPVIVNNNNIDASQTNSSSQATTFRIPESVRSGEPTMATAIAAYEQ